MKIKSKNSEKNNKDYSTKMVKFTKSQDKKTKFDMLPEKALFYDFSIFASFAVRYEKGMMRWEKKGTTRCDSSKIVNIFIIFRKMLLQNKTSYDIM